MLDVSPPRWQLEPLRWGTSDDWLGALPEIALVRIRWCITMEDAIHIRATSKTWRGRLIRGSTMTEVSIGCVSAQSSNPSFMMSEDASMKMIYGHRTLYSRAPIPRNPRAPIWFLSYHDLWRWRDCSMHIPNWLGALPKDVLWHGVLPFLENIYNLKGVCRARSKTVIVRDVSRFIREFDETGRTIASNPITRLMISHALEARETPFKRTSQCEEGAYMDKAQATASIFSLFLNMRTHLARGLIDIADAKEEFDRNYDWLHTHHRYGSILRNYLKHPTKRIEWRKLENAVRAGYSRPKTTAFYKVETAVLD